MEFNHDYVSVIILNVSILLCIVLTKVGYDEIEL